MENTIANKAICLNLNANWQPVGYKTVKDAIIDLCGCDADGKPSSMAIDIDYDVDANGEPILGEPKSMTPVAWSDWINLPIRSWDLVIHTNRLAIRVPTVIIATNFTKMPVKQFKGKPSKDAIYTRDNGICQYTGRKIDRHNATVDHVLPRSKGGADSWENLVLCAKDVNSKKGNKLNSEVGLSLRRKPVAPSPIPVYALIQDAKHVDWEHFLIKK
jgi:hypothetical protein